MSSDKSHVGQWFHVISPPCPRGGSVDLRFEPHIIRDCLHHMRQYKDSFLHQRFLVIWRGYHKLGHFQRWLFLNQATKSKKGNSTVVYLSQIVKQIFKIIIPNTRILHLPEALMTHKAKPLLTSFTVEHVGHGESCHIWTCCEDKESNIFAGKPP